MDDDGLPRPPDPLPIRYVAAVVAATLIGCLVVGFLLLWML